MDELLMSRVWYNKQLTSAFLNTLADLLSMKLNCQKVAFYNVKYIYLINHYHRPDIKHISHD